MKKVIRKFSFKSKLETNEDGKAQRKTSAEQAAAAVANNEAVDHQGKSETSGEVEPLKKERKRSSRKITQPRKASEFKCAVCLKEYQDAKVLPCEHQFCLECVRPFLNPKDLLSCPSCKQEHPILRGDLASLKNAHVASKNQRKISSTCSQCSSEKKSEDSYQLCLHCQKVFCPKCFNEHVAQLREQTRQIVAQIEEATSKWATLVKVKFQSLEEKADEMEKDQIKQIQESRNNLQKHLDDVATKEEKKVEEVLENMQQLQEEAKEIASLASDSDLVKSVIQLHQEYEKVVLNSSHMSAISGYEISPTFQLVNNAKHEAGKIEANLKSLNPTPLENPVASVTFGPFKKWKAFSTSSRPTCVKTSPWNDKEIFVCLPDEKSVVVFDCQSGKKLRTVEVADFQHPIKLAFLHAQKIIVLDQWEQSLIVIDEEIDNSYCIGDRSKSSGRFRSPCGLATNPQDQSIIVADTGNNRVCLFSKLGKFMRYIGGKMQKGPDGRQHFYTDLCQPEDVVYDGSVNMIIIADTGNHRVRTFTSSGDPLAIFGMQGTGNGQFELPTTVAFSRASFILVCELDSNRLQIFTLDGRFVSSIVGFRNTTSMTEASSDSQIMYMTDGKQGAVYQLDFH